MVPPCEKTREKWRVGPGFRKVQSSIMRYDKCIHGGRKVIHILSIAFKWADETGQRVFSHGGTIHFSPTALKRVTLLPGRPDNPHSQESEPVRRLGEICFQTFINLVLQKITNANLQSKGGLSTKSQAKANPNQVP